MCCGTQEFPGSSRRLDLVATAPPFFYSKGIAHPDGGVLQ